MPPHPELTGEQAHAMAQWIEKEAANPNVHEYVGTDGAIRMEAPAAPAPSARTEDHGELYGPPPHPPIASKLRMAKIR
ncbi:MAG: hypothetical protein WA294_09245 [Acidobacteriaceae bacterium]